MIKKMLVVPKHNIYLMAKHILTTNIIDKIVATKVEHTFTYTCIYENNYNHCIISSRIELFYCENISVMYICVTSTDIVSNL